MGNCYKGCARVKKHRSDIIPQIEQRNSGIVVEFYKPRRVRDNKQNRSPNLAANENFVFEKERTDIEITPELEVKLLNIENKLLVEPKTSTESKFSTSSFQSSKDEGIVA